MTAQEMPANVGGYMQTWAVANVDLNPAPPTTAYSGFMPRRCFIASFTPPARLAVPRHWSELVFTLAVALLTSRLRGFGRLSGFVTSTASYNTSANTAASSWSSAQSKISFSMKTLQLTTLRLWIPLRCPPAITVRLSWLLKPATPGAITRLTRAMEPVGFGGCTSRKPGSMIRPSAVPPASGAGCSHNRYGVGHPRNRP